MQDIFISLNSNIARLSFVDKNGLHTFESEITKEAVDGCRLVDTNLYANELESLIIKAGLSRKDKIAVTFLMGPSDVMLMYLSPSKKQGDVDEQLISEVKTKLSGIQLETLYFGYNKIAPFVYQFTGIFKDTVEKYLNVANLLGVELKCLSPWMLLLPKYLNENGPSALLVKIGNDFAVGLSDLGGVYFSNTYDGQNISEGIQKVSKSLSFYKKNSNVNKLYNLCTPALDIGGEYISTEVKLPESGFDVPSGFEVNVIANFLADTKADSFDDELNLLNLLPLPAVSKKSGALVKVGIGVTALVAVSVLLFVFVISPKNKDVPNNLASSNPDTQVLSSSSTPTPTPVPSVVAELKKSDLTLKIENGAGVNGLAARTKEAMEKLGYKVSDIATADSNRAATLLRFKKDKIAYKDLLMSDMKDNFPNIVIEDTLSSSENYDVLVVAGTTASL